jgi:hypothetical protein
MRRKAARSENHGMAKLTNKQVREIRLLHISGRRGKKGSGNTAKLADKYGVHPNHVLSISRGASRKDG